MPYTVLGIIDDSKALLGDPAARRVSDAQWLTFYNRACRKTANKFNCLKTIAVWDIIAGTEQYLYPDDMVTMSKIEYNPAGEGSDPNYWRRLREVFEDEFIKMTNNNMPSGEPTHYYSTQAFFQLIPQPSSTILLGGRINYWRHPATVSLTIANLIDPSVVMEFPDFLRDYIVDNMVANAKQRLYMYAEAQEDYRTIAQQEPALTEKLEDRSLDRRAALRPRSYDDPYRELV